jgi:hypothetical protein
MSILLTPQPYHLITVKTNNQGIAFVLDRIREEGRRQVRTEGRYYRQLHVLIYSLVCTGATMTCAQNEQHGALRGRR